MVSSAVPASLSQVAGHFRQKTFTMILETPSANELRTLPQSFHATRTGRIGGVSDEKKDRARILHEHNERMKVDEDYSFKWQENERAYREANEYFNQ